MPAKKSPHKSGKKYFWKDADKSRGVAAYVSIGSFTKAAAITGIPENTLRLWSKQEWWAEESLRVVKVDSDELTSTFTRIAKKASAELEDRLDNGDEVLTKDGEIKMKKIPGRELAIIAAVAADKRKQGLEQPNLVPIQNQSEKLLTLMQEFLKYSNAKTIAGEVINAEQPELQAKLQTGVRNGEQAETRSSIPAEYGEARND